MYLAKASTLANESKKIRTETESAAISSEEVEPGAPASTVATSVRPSRGRGRGNSAHSVRGRRQVNQQSPAVYNGPPPARNRGGERGGPGNRRFVKPRQQHASQPRNLEREVRPRGGPTPPVRYFILKSNDKDDVLISQKDNIWATQHFNEDKLNEAFDVAFLY